MWLFCTESDWRWLFRTKALHCCTLSGCKGSIFLKTVMSTGMFLTLKPVSHHKCTCTYTRMWLCTNAKQNQGCKVSVYLENCEQKSWDLILKAIPLKWWGDRILWLYSPPTHFQYGDPLLPLSLYGPPLGSKSWNRRVLTKHKPTNKHTYRQIWPNLLPPCLATLCGW